MRKMTFNEATAYYMAMDGFSAREAIAYVRGLERTADEAPWIWPNCNCHNPYAEPDNNDTSDDY